MSAVANETVLGVNGGELCVQATRRPACRLHPMRCWRDGRPWRDSFSRLQPSVVVIAQLGAIHSLRGDGDGGCDDRRYRGGALPDG